MLDHLSVEVTVRWDISFW